MEARHFDAICRGAEGALRARRWSAAVDAYRRALALQPTFADGWFNLGYALRQQGDFPEALDAYAQALRHGVSDPAMVHVNRAAILSDHLRRDADAAQALQDALAIAPAYPAALLNLGNLREEQGARDAAVACYRTLIDAHPASTPDVIEALARLLQLVAPARLDDPVLVQVMHAATHGHALPDTLRATLWSTLGRALDALGDTDAAFAAFGQGKRFAHRGSPAYDPVSAQARTQALIDAFPRAATTRQSVTRHPEPVFICGMFRSGSTLLEQVLAAHPDVAAAGELDLLPRMARHTLAPFPAGAAALNGARCEELADGYHAALRERLSGNGRDRRFATDKRPDNYLLIGLIKQLFPSARILHTVRNPRDTALSIFMQHLNPRAFPYAASLDTIAHQMGEHQRLMAHWKTLYPGDILHVDYDAFVAAPEPAIRGVLAHLGLAWASQCLQFHALGNTVKTASYWQVRRPLYPEASGRWRLYRHHLGQLDAALGTAGVLPAQPLSD